MLKSQREQTSSVKFYVYTSIYFANFVLFNKDTLFTYDAQTHTLQFTTYNASATYKAFLIALSDIFRKFHKPFFLKIKFKGKGYYVYKNQRNTIAPQFNYAHRVYVYSFTNSVKFLSKTKILLFGLSKKDV